MNGANELIDKLNGLLSELSQGDFANLMDTVLEHGRAEGLLMAADYIADNPDMPGPLVIQHLENLAYAE